MIMEPDARLIDVGYQLGSVEPAISIAPSTLDGNGAAAFSMAPAQWQRRNRGICTVMGWLQSAGCGCEALLREPVVAHEAVGHVQSADLR